MSDLKALKNIKNETDLNIQIKYDSYPAIFFEKIDDSYLSI